ncbi:YtxH domain-containing protein [Pseudanabaena yagii]|uniref:YtxH domain-containing protein n=1 Tax=Pseudanabaena yagii GIHE-NHR1 TaxID=2722753 RepID=A0ABX1LYS7_9CYAN|nr:YtxH domain-containing protein [Pseudanabaena yagii]NMF60606.1 YtxH domain-containing protein [Pseudanabaena yagii GIHE-NHR1]
MSNGAGKFFGGVIVGTVIGAAVGILFAPRSGKETRQVLKRSAKDLPKLAEEVSANVQYQADRLTVQAQRTIDEALIRLQEAIATGQEASRKLQDELILSMANTSNNSSIEIDDIPVEDED